MPSKQKQRLDLTIVKKGLAESRQRAQALIMAGRVLVGRQVIDKPGALIFDSVDISIKGEDIPYVSRGGFKLEAALKSFELNVKDFICLDVGASTGGFTDCLLQHGASFVYAVDVGYGQLAWKLRLDRRVAVIERTNIRYMTAEIIKQPVDLITIDVSFISLKIVVPSILRFIKNRSGIIALIKPQFEAGKGRVGKGGIVRDPTLHDKVINDLSDFFSAKGLFCKSLISSPILGSKGNKEFIVFLEYKKEA